MTEAMTPYYLKPNAQIEPLINGWAAHPFLLSPMSAPHFIHRQLKIMQSYVQMPMLHAAAVQNPEMRGGEFIDYGGGRVDEIARLMASMEHDNRTRLEFREAALELLDLLESKQDCAGFEDIYRQMPEAVRGYVELVYDLSHRPSVRFLESVLYRSQAHRPSNQSICLSLVNSDERRFVFGTPRLPDDDNLVLDIGFDDARIDYLARLRSRGGGVADIQSAMGLDVAQSRRLSKFLTTEKPRQQLPFSGDGVRVRYFGHACVLLEANGCSILVDPLMSYEHQTAGVRFTDADLPEKIDFVVITHSHHDHFVIEQLLQLRHRIGTVVLPRGGHGMLQDPSLKLACRHLGFDNVIELDDLDQVDIRSGSITALPFFGEHCDLDVRTKATFRIELLGRSFLFIADSNNLSPHTYRVAREVVGPADVLFISQECTGAPMHWAYGALFPRKLDTDVSRSRRSYGPDSQAAIEHIQTFGCGRVFLYAMGLERWLNYLMALQDDHCANTEREVQKVLAYCRDNSIPAEVLNGSRELLL